MDRTARERFRFFLDAMDRATSQFDLTEARRGADDAAKKLGMTFHEARRAHQAGWPASDVDDDDEGGSAEPSAVRAETGAAVHSRSSARFDAAPTPSEKSFDHLSTEAPTLDAVAAALAADPSRSDRDIAREANCSPTTVGRARAAAGLVRLVRKVTRGGSSYDMAVVKHVPPAVHGA